MCFDPVTLAAGAALSAGGKYLSDKNAQNQAQREADARNAVVAKGVQKQGEYATANRGDFNTGLSTFDPNAQAAGLAGAQGARSAGNVGAITQQTGDDIEIPSGSSPAVRGEIAKRLAATFGQSVDRAKAAGKLGGYADQGANNTLNVAQMGRDIGTRNTQSQLESSIIAPQADLAASGTYRPPSPWGTILQGAGNILGASAGRPGGFQPNIGVGNPLTTMFRP